MSKPQYISKEGLVELKKELQYLKIEKRQEISQRLQEAKTFGDLSENAEYQEAKEAQSATERRIIELEEIIKNSRIIEKPTKKNIVLVGATVEVKFDGEKREFTIVGSEEADPASGKISNESPLGKAFLDRKVGEEVDVRTPKGNVKYKILRIS
ncbi:MAG: transcription elongation factor GreA [bacterium]|nr:transcription elongation factor GreA [bacterium]